MGSGGTPGGGQAVGGLGGEMYVGAGPVEVGVWFLDSGSLEQLLVGRTKEQKAGREEEKQNDKDLVREQSGYRGP